MPTPPLKSPRRRSYAGGYIALMAVVIGGCWLHPTSLGGAIPRTAPKRRPKRRPAAMPLLSSRPRCRATARLSPRVALAAVVLSGALGTSTVQAAGPVLVARSTQSLSVKPTANGQAALVESSRVGRSDSSLSIWRVNAPKLEPVAHGNVAGLAISDNGESAGYACGEQTFCIWQRGEATVRRITDLCAAGYPVNPVAMSADLKTLLVQCQVPSGSRLVHIGVRSTQVTKLPAGFGADALANNGASVIMESRRHTYIYAAGHLHKLSSIGYPRAVSPNGRFIVAEPPGIGGGEASPAETVAFEQRPHFLIYDMASGSIHEWLAPLNPLLSEWSTPRAISNNGELLVADGLGTFPSSSNCTDDSACIIELVNLRTHQARPVVTASTENDSVVADALSANSPTLFYSEMACGSGSCTSVIYERGI
jgi:hypothetical protein